MAVPGVTFTDEGFVAPDERTEVLPGVLSDVDAAMGGGLNPALETPQGQLSSSMSAAVGNVYDSFARLVQMFDPAYAFGRYQDALARIYFIDRFGALPTVVSCTLNGAAGVLIPQGSLGKSEDGNLYSCSADTTIPVGGTINVDFICTTMGPISCPAGTLTTIYQAIPGWDAITNADDGILGRATETRQDFERRRALSTAKNSIGSLPSVLGEVLAVDGVLDAFVTENVDDLAAVIGGATLGPHTLYVSAIGGVAADIAKAIWTKKGPGCGYNGNTTVTVFDTSPHYTPPYPAYSVMFEVPPVLPFVFDVELANNSQVPSDVATQVKNAIINAFAGADGGERARIGATVYASRFYAAISSLGPWARVKTILLGTTNTAAAVFNGQTVGAVLTVTSMISGALADNQTVQGTNVLAGTTILNQINGTPGAAGDYTISKSQTVGLRQMSVVVADQNLVAVKINQAPAVSADDIKVVVS